MDRKCGILNPGTELGTLCRKIDEEAKVHNPNVVKVVRNQSGRALYFSRAPTVSQVAFSSGLRTKISESSGFNLAGLSLGGHIAWRFSIDYPKRVSRLCLLNPTGFPDKEVPPIFKLRRSFLGGLIPYLGTYSMAEENITKLFYDPAKIPTNFIKQCHTSQLAEGNRRAFLKFLRAPENFRHKELKNLSMPVQLMWSKV